MGTINPDLSGIVDGDVADAADFTTPLNTIIDEINGNLDNDNIKSGAAVDVLKVPSAVKAVDRQNNTTNATVSTQRICHGWGFLTGAGTSDIASETVSFPIEFGDTPMVFMNSTGYKASNPSDPGDVTGLSGQAGVACWAADPSTTGFTAAIGNVAGDNLTNGRRYVYQWMAIGTKAT